MSEMNLFKIQTNGSGHLNKRGEVQMIEVKRIKLGNGWTR